MKRRDFVKLAPAFPVAAVTASLTLRETGKEPVELDVSVLKCQPGDTLVLTAPDNISEDTAARIKAWIEHTFENRIKAMVLGDGLTIEGVIRAPHA